MTIVAFVQAHLPAAEAHAVTAAPTLLVQEATLLQAAELAVTQAAVQAAVLVQEVILLQAAEPAVTQAAVLAAALVQEVTQHQAAVLRQAALAVTVLVRQAVQALLQAAHADTVQVLQEAVLAVTLAAVLAAVLAEAEAATEAAEVDADKPEKTLY